MACPPAFLEWCKQHGIEWLGIEPGVLVADGWRGVVATRTIEPADVIMSVPERLLMSSHSARRDATLGALLAAPPHDRLTSHQALCAHLLHELSKGSASFWAPYLQQLPRSYATLSNFSDAARAALQAPHAVAAAAAAAARARADWLAGRALLRDAELGGDAGGGKWLSWRAWRWADGCVLSRTMHLPGAEAGALTPLGDLHNYAPPRSPPFAPEVEAIGGCGRGCGDGEEEDVREEEEAEEEVPPSPSQPRDGAADDHGDGATALAAGTDSASSSSSAAISERDGRGDAAEMRAADADADDVTATTSSIDGGNGGGDGAFDAAARAYRLYARQRYEAGQQVYLCYGAHINLELLELYGFCLPRGANAHDTALVPRGALLGAATAAGLRGTSGGNTAAALSDEALLPAAECAVHANGAPSWALLRQLRLAAATPAEARSARGHAAHAGERISDEGDARALRALRGACAASLAALPTSADEDEALLASAGQVADADTAAASDGDGQAAANVSVSIADEDAAAALERECVAAAITWRLGYKRTLQRCLEWCDARLPPPAPLAQPLASKARGVS